MKFDRQTALVFGAAATLRLLLFTASPSLPDLLTGRVEVSTPVSSFKRCEIHYSYNLHYAYSLHIVQEGLFLYNHNVSPYDGGVFHQVSIEFARVQGGVYLLNIFQAPLFLPLFSLLPNSLTHPFATYLLYTFVDLLGANALMRIAQSGQNVSTRLYTSPRKDLRWSPVALAAG